MRNYEGKQVFKNCPVRMTITPILMQISKNYMNTEDKIEVIYIDIGKTDT